MAKVGVKETRQGLAGGGGNVIFIVLRINLLLLSVYFELILKKLVVTMYKNLPIRS